MAVIGFHGKHTAYFLKKSMPQFHINLEMSNLSIWWKMFRMPNFQWQKGWGARGEEMS